MAAGIAKTGAPAWARLTWYDDGHIFMEMPVVDSYPIIMKFSATEGGYSEALKMQRKIYDDAGPHRERNGWNLDHPIIKRGTKSKPTFTAEQKANASKVVKKMMEKIK